MNRLACARIAVIVGIQFVLIVPAVAGFSLEVDAREAPRRIFHVTQHFSVSPGPFTLVYPKWIPGAHGPTGPVGDVVNVRMVAGDNTVPWRRDSEDLYEFHCRVPDGEERLTVTFDYVSPVGAGVFTASPASTARLTIIDWHLMLMYPDGARANETRADASLRYPADWSWGGALSPREESEGYVSFEPMSLELLVDTPIIAGAYHRSVQLREAADGRPRHVLEIAGDSAWSLDAPEERIAAYGRLVDETLALFGAWHYSRYHFLLTLTEHGDHFGLEHHMTSDNRMGETFLIDDEVHADAADLLPHELFHAWNGKSFRPHGMIVRNYQEPIDSTLLLVYEGLTTYYGDVLAARAGLRSDEEAREALANWAAYMDHVAGRQWRPLEDTTTAARMLYGRGRAWRSLRRSVDFYLEGLLIWLEADTLIREKSDGAKSLDDFCGAFYGGGRGEIMVKSYRADDVFRALNRVVSHDWQSFFYSRLREPNERAPMDGLTQAGWKLVYTNQPNAFAGDKDGVNALYSLGAVLGSEGVIEDAVPGMPLYEAGLGPGMRIVAVNGRKFTPTVLKKALQAKATLELIVENADYFSVHSVDYDGGERYPHLERINDAPDRLAAIFAPIAQRTSQE